MFTTILIITLENFKFFNKICHCQKCTGHMLYQRISPLSQVDYSSRKEIDVIINHIITIFYS